MAKLNFKVFGEGEPLVIMHGLYGSSDNWVSIARELMNKHRVYLLDMRNHGSSPHMLAHNYAVMTDDLLEFMNDRNMYDANILGHSMGGKVAMSFVSLYPEKVKKLIVVDISPRGYSSSAGDKQLVEHSAILDALSAIHLPEVVSRKQVDEDLSEKIASESVRMFLLKNLARTKEQNFYWKINLQVLKESLDNIVIGLESEFDDLRDFSNPALFIKGGYSKYIQEQDMVMINSIFSDVQIVEIDQASHWVHAEKKEEFLQVLQNFL